MNIFYVYAHYDIMGDLKYIGKGCKNRAYRTDGRSKLWKRTFPEGAYEIKFFVKNISENEAFKIEKSAIAEAIDNGDPLINICPGGDGGSTWMFTDETRDYLSKIRSGKNHPLYGKKVSEEIIAKTQKTLKERDSYGRYWKGRKRDPELMENLVKAAHTPEAIEKRAAKRRGMKLPKEWREKISKGNIGRIITEETRKKIGKKNAINHKGKKPHDNCRLAQIEWAKKPRTKEHTENARASRVRNGKDKGYTTKKAKAVRCVETGIIYRSAGEAAKKLGYINDKGIWKVVSGNRKTYKKFHWEYV